MSQPRLYNTSAAPQRRSLLPTPAPQRPIPADAKLYSIKESSRLLTERYGEGYSESAIRQLIASADWIEGVHWADRRRKGGKYRRPKVYLEAVQRWQVARVSDRP